ncbi:MAG: hypothetical protein ABJA79_01765, partial [Parafilimonas sp.]
DASYKSRPALILKQLPKYNDFLVCGISAQISQYIHDCDEIINEHDVHFHETGLLKTILILAKNNNLPVSPLFYNEMQKNLISYMRNILISLKISNP